MAYSPIEQHSRDLDIFLRDSDKFIHFASAGGMLPEGAVNSDVYNNLVIEELSQDNSDSEIEINPNISELLSLTDDDLTDYLASFVEMAKKGFFSYDKSKLGDFEDQTFHLVAKPKSPIKPNVLYEKFKSFEKIINTQKVFPTEFEVFDISEYI
ncbi:MAG: hypothetical protein U0T69_10900 [Chitinophagales bacterium]